MKRGPSGPGTRTGLSHVPAALGHMTLVPKGSGRWLTGWSTLTGEQTPLLFSAAVCRSCMVWDRVAVFWGFRDRKFRAEDRELVSLALERQGGWPE